MARKMIHYTVRPMWGPQKLLDEIRSQAPKPGEHAEVYGKTQRRKMQNVQIEMIRRGDF